MNRLQEKVCIVTGSSSGLGRAIALAYAKEGAHVVCADLSSAARKDIAAETAIATDELIIQQGGKAIFVQVDVAQASAWQNLVKQAVSKFGRIDVLVNNAGVSVEAGRPRVGVHETSEDMWDVTMAVNVKSIFLGCKYVIAQMLQQNPKFGDEMGWIINMSSIMGIVAGRNNCSYAASKGAVSNLTRQIAIDYGGQKIHCNAICPGFTRTAIFEHTVRTLDSEDEIASRHPLRGIGAPEHIVGAAIFLASKDAAWITGVCLPVDGGYLCQ